MEGPAVLSVGMFDRPPAEGLAIPVVAASAPALAAAPAYESPTLVEVGTLRDLTAAGSFGDPT